ncbi:hypothetical protein [Paractinoplanes atraurantiacus]|uniref:Uncharacterized protein n=1 Tax=Paractinoplanes atraurantiacus TaxID=1036182 RepID=A0A285J4D5_9ACTN|nr:hypothetical protein [Actinoplanes atraurantiacus]SNY55072.1 hypothetical protein SAMN05421748_11625 [Actinoplanes atraurantiacus]
MRFTVAAGSYDRLALTVGPKQYSEGDPPTIVAGEVTLVDDAGRRLPAGSFAVVDAGSDGNLHWDWDQKAWAVNPDDMPPERVDCYHRNHDLVDGVLDEPGRTIAPELTALQETLEAL